MRCDMLTVDAAASDKKLAFRDQLLEEVLKWFRSDFFQWTNQPPCQYCKGGTNQVSIDRPNSEEAKFRPGVVEVYKCGSASCGKITRFPRYNHAGKLLETRRGRCGEFAQAFTLIARAMG